MNVNYRTTPQGCYLVLSHPEQKDFDRYSLQMILKNRIPGLLKTEQEILNGQISLLYDITSMRSLAALMEKEKIGQEHFRALITDMSSCADRTREYLLNMNQLLFIPEYIFFDQNSKCFLFCFDPCYEGDYQSDIRELFDRMLGSIDYEDPDYVKLVYELHMSVQKDNFRFSDLSELMSRTDGSETVSIRGMFEENAGSGSNSSGGEQAFSLTQDSGAYKGPLPLHRNNSATEKKNIGFLDKLKVYLKGKTLWDIISDIDNGVFLQKLNHIEKELPGLEMKITSGRGKRKTEEPVKRIAMETKNWTIGKETARITCLAGIGKYPESLIEIRKYPFSIGKLDGEVDAVIDSPTVSRIHARIQEYRPDPSAGCLIEDLNSTNGTFVNGMRLEPYTKNQIRAGDVIRFADREYILRYRLIQSNNSCNSPENEI